MRVVHAEHQAIRALEHRALVAQLGRAARRRGRGERARVGAGLVDVELLGVEPPSEPHQREREAGAELLAEARGRDVHVRLEEVAARVIQRAVAPEIRERQRARLLDPVLRALERQAGVRAAGLEAELREELFDPRRRDVSPAVLPEEGAADVVVEGRRRAAHSEAVLLAPEAAALHLRHDLVRRRSPTARDDVDGAAEGVAAEHRCRTADHLDPLDVVERQQVVVDLFDSRLVHAHAVDEDAQALRLTADGGGSEAAERQIHLPRVPLLVAQGHARQARERFLERHGPAAAEPIGRDDVDGGRNAREWQPRARQARGRSDAQLRQARRVVLRSLR